MKLRRLSSALAATAVVTAVSVPAAFAASAHQTPATASTGTRSLAAVLTSKGYAFDHNWNDYDIVTHAVLAVLAAKPNSPVKVLTQGSKPVTAFVPEDRAFRALAKDLTGRWLPSEKQVFDTLARKLGVNTIEKVLLYHVVPGATIDSGTALRSDGARLRTALSGQSVTVDVVSRHDKLIRLEDNDHNDANPWIDRKAFDINKGNKQIAHGITLVLRPVDL